MQAWSSLISSFEPQVLPLLMSFGDRCQRDLNKGHEVPIVTRRTLELSGLLILLTIPQRSENLKPTFLELTVTDQCSCS